MATRSTSTTYMYRVYCTLVPPADPLYFSLAGWAITVCVRDGAHSNERAGVLSFVLPQSFSLSLLPPLASSRQTSSLAGKPPPPALLHGHGAPPPAFSIGSSGPAPSPLSSRRGRSCRYRRHPHCWPDRDDAAGRCCHAHCLLLCRQRRPPPPAGACRPHRRLVGGGPPPHRRRHHRGAAMGEPASPLPPSARREWRRW